MAETVTVLLGASTSLSTAVIVTVPVLVVAPAAIVRVVPVRVKSPEAVFAPAAAATVRVTATFDLPDTVLVFVAPLSLGCGYVGAVAVSAFIYGRGAELQGNGWRAFIVVDGKGLIGRVSQTASASACGGRDCYRLVGSVNVVVHGSDSHCAGTGGGTCGYREGSYLLE